MNSLLKHKAARTITPQRVFKAAFFPAVALLLVGCSQRASEPVAAATPVAVRATAADATQAKAELMKLLGGESTEFPTPDAEQLKLLKEAQAQAAKWAQVVMRGELKAASGGAGIVICDPVVQSNTNPDASAFAAGCARWLQVALGGQKTLDQSPMWSSIAGMQGGMGFSNLQLDQKKATALARAVGATHVVTARTENTPGISWQLLTVAGSAVGKPILTAGTDEQILTQLPVVARELGRRLRASSVQIPPVGVNVEELRFLGASAQVKGSVDNAAELRLRKLAAREPLAGLLWMQKGGIDSDRDPIWRDVVRKSVTLAPENTLIWSSLVGAPRHLRPHRAAFDKLVRENPRNLILVLSQVYASSATNDFNMQLKAATRAVASNARSGAAWIALSKAFANKADSIRNGRYYSRMSEQEKAAIAEYYPHQLMAVLYATRIAPASPAVWSQVCEAATFNSEPELADLALWKALRLDPDNLADWRWGMEIYQPKWFDNSVRMLLVARHIASKPERLTQIAIPFSYALHAAGFEDASVAATRAALALLESQVGAEPKNIEAWKNLAYIYREEKRYEDAVWAFESWIALEPENTIPLNNLANWHAKNNRDTDKMLKLYERAAEIAPQDARIIYNWGGYYKDYPRDFDKAVPLMKKAMALDKNYTLPVTALGNLYWFLKNDEKTARKYFQEAMQRDPLDGYVRAEFAYALMRHGKKDEAKKHAQRALQLGEDEHPVFKELGMDPSDEDSRYEGQDDNA